jgi:hypothetical protein
MPYRDPEKQREYKRKWNKKNGLKIKGYITEFRKDGCLRCNEIDHDALCAHHRVPKDKEFSVSRLWKIGLSVKRVLRELEKCDCLCLNCHAKLHGRLRREQNGST